MTHQRSVTLITDEISKCMSFAVSFSDAKAQKSSKDFGSKTAEIRELNSKVADTMSGKHAEYAFMKLCKSWVIDITIDFDISSGKLNVDDGQDVTTVEYITNKIKCDIKGAKQFAQWLMIESHKIDENIINADIYIFIRLDIPSEVRKDLSLLNKNTIKATFSGYALRSDFFDSNFTPWFEYPYDSSPFNEFMVKNIVQNTLMDISDGEVLTKHHFTLAARALRH